MTTSSGTFTVTFKQTAKEIIQRLYDTKAISFDELETLLEAIRKDYTPPYVPDYPQWPNYPYPSPISPIYVGNPGTITPIDPRAPSTCTQGPLKVTATYSSTTTGKYDDLKPELTVKDGL